MEIKKENYTPEFQEVLKHCESNKLFLGEGNPNSKILIIGKEVGGGSPKSLEEIIRSSDDDAKRNIETWTNPNGYDLMKLKTDIFNDGKNPTWSNYQKLVSKIIGKDLGKDNYNFLDYCFMTELSQIHLPNSNYDKNLTKEESQEIKTIRQKSVKERAELLSMPFFRNFPIIIMACGHYPRELNFDIEKVFSVEWTKETKGLSIGNFYNLHYGTDKILIHTRQVSLGVTNQLLFEIAELCKSFYK